MLSEDDRWWDHNGQAAGDALNEIFGGEVAPTYRNADHVARNVLLLMAPLLRADSSYSDTEAREKLRENLVRVCDLARALYIGVEVDQSEIHGGRFVMTCLEPIGAEASHVLLSIRYALAALAITQASVVFDELWLHSGPEAWSLASCAYDELSALELVHSSEEDFAVRPDNDVVSLATAHRISDAIRAVGGGETMSNN